MNELERKRLDNLKKGEYLLCAMGELYFSILSEYIDKINPQIDIDTNHEVIIEYGNVAIEKLYDKLVGTDVYKHFDVDPQLN